MLKRKVFLGIASYLISSVLMYELCKPLTPETTAKGAMPKVVQIRVGNHCGAGAFITPNGYILTCAHLFRVKGELTVNTVNGNVYPAQLCKLDPERDLAIIKINGLKDFPYFKFGLTPVPGQEVIAIGSPYLLMGTVSVGYVEKLDLYHGRAFIHGAFINPGNSGGPLLNLKGQLIGINSAIIMANPLVPANGLYLAVSRNTIKFFLHEMEG